MNRSSIMKLMACPVHHREEGGCDDEHALATAGCTEGKCEPGDGEHVDYDVENTVETVVSRAR